MEVLLKLAWYDGWLTGARGDGLSACPWPLDSLRGEQWRLGRAMGERERLPESVAVA